MSDRTLPSKWQFWVICFNHGKGIPTSYEIEPIISTGSVHSFCRYFWNIPKPSELRVMERKRVSLAFFRDNIKPAWEDENNKLGASFYFLVKKGERLDDVPRKERKIGKEEFKVDEIWLELLLRSIGGEFDEKIKDVNKLNGLIIVPKDGAYGIEVWMENENEVPEMKKILEEYWRKGNDPDAEMVENSIQFLPHKRDRK